MLETPPKPDWLKSMFPWEQKSLAVNGRRMSYIDEGGRAAPIVLLLHGNPTWGFLYRDFVEPLKTQGYRVIVPDCIGAGYSSKPRMDTAYSLAHHIADLVSLIDQRNQVGDVMRQRIRRIHAWLAGIPRADAVRHDDAIALRLQRLDKIAVEKTPGRIAMQQEHDRRRTAALVDVRHSTAVDGERLLFPRKHAFEPVRFRRRFEHLASPLLLRFTIPLHTQGRKT